MQPERATLLSSAVASAVQHRFEFKQQLAHPARRRHFVSPVHSQTILTLISMMLLILVLSSHSKAQSETPKFELGVHFSALPLDDDPTNNAFCDACDTFTYKGVGGRFTYNVNNSLALESELNFFRANNRMRNRRVGGWPLQGLFGVKVGKRFEKVGLFAKVRPGFLSFSDAVSSIFPGTFIADYSRRTHFNIDVGGVLEFYPARRLVLRLDAGDTIIHYAKEDLVSVFFPFPAATRHNLQFNAGVGFRF